MQIADVRRDFGDDLAVGPQHQPQHAVRAGMLRPHVDEHLVGADVEFNNTGIFNLHDNPEVRSRWSKKLQISNAKSQTIFQSKKVQTA